MDWYGQLSPGTGVPDAPGAQGRLGTFMFVSTLSHRFEDYDVYHSRCDLAVGGVLQQDWCY